MIRLSERIHGRDIVVQCEDYLHRQAVFLVDLLKQTQPELIGEGNRLRVGWSILTFRSRDDELLVCEPDFSGNPFESTRDDVTWTLLVLARQQDCLRDLGLAEVPVCFHDKIVIAAGCLGESKIYLERKPPKAGDSGWYIGRPDPSGNNTDLEAIYVYQLLESRPLLMQYLLLPPGYLIVLEGERVLEVLDENDRPVPLTRSSERQGWG